MAVDIHTMVLVYFSKAERAISVLVNMGAEDKNTKYSR